MPKGPNGEKRPANAFEAAIVTAKILSGEITEEVSPQREGGLAGGQTRAKKLSSEQRSEIARKAAKARWKKASDSSSRS